MKTYNNGFFSLCKKIKMIVLYLCIPKCQITSSPVYTCKLADGRHGIALFPEKGEIILDVLEVDITNEKISNS